MTVNAAVASVLAFGAAAVTIARSVELLGVSGVIATALVWGLAGSAGLLAGRKAASSGIRKYRGRSGKIALLSPQTWVTFTAAAFSAVLTGGALSWLALVNGRWQLSGIGDLLVTVAAVAAPMALAWLAVARYVHGRVHRK
ncbi:hypothetical protein [Nocardia sp. NRRL S-836]|uniref:hypothetical protein n=1 Tax=Nocardia sp. NRRL S-836 TaxID=1519492 RepID=UPI0012F8EB6A|nr:hypothetical protein [Nocardia sp. NRRL S-836]